MFLALPSFCLTQPPTKKQNEKILNGKGVCKKHLGFRIRKQALPNSRVVVHLTKYKYS